MNPTREQYATKMVDLLDSHDVILPSGYMTHVNGIAQALVEEDEANQTESVASVVRAYLKAHGLEQYESDLAYVKAGLISWRVAVKYRGLTPTEPVSGAASTSPDQEPTAPPFDRENAASVIRAFIQAGQRHVQRGRGHFGYSPTEVDALLVLAGITDEVTQPCPTCGHVA